MRHFQHFDLLDLKTSIKSFINGHFITTAMFEQLKEITNCTFIPFLIDTNRYIDKISLSQSILFTPCTQAYIEKLGHMTLRHKTDQTGGFDELLLKSRLASCYSRITRIGDMSAAILTRKIPRSDFRVSFIFYYHE